MTLHLMNFTLQYGVHSLSGFLTPRLLDLQSVGYDTALYGSANPKPLYGSELIRRSLERSKTAGNIQCSLWLILKMYSSRS